MEYNLTDLKKKAVVNVADGRNLGRITDMVIGFPSGVVSGIIVPGRKNSFFGGGELIISTKCIERIGDDTILVRLCKEGAAKAILESVSEIHEE